MHLQILTSFPTDYNKISFLPGKAPLNEMANNSINQVAKGYLSWKSCMTPSEYMQGRQCVCHNITGVMAHLKIKHNNQIGNSSLT